jgi:hypothetical protein
MTMKTTKSLMLAALAALSLGVGTAMAQESSGAPGPYETAQLNQMLAAQHAAALAASNHAPQYGSSERPVFPVPTLQGGDGSGG